MALVVYIVTFLLTLLLYYNFIKKRKVNLPGPWGIPIFGSALECDKRFYVTFQKWSKKYGNMYFAQLGKDPVVVISDPKIVKEMYTSDVFTGRMQMEVFSLYENQPNLGLVNSEGESWEQLRRFTLRQLRDFGFGKSSMEALIMDEVKEFNDFLSLNEGRPIDNVKQRFSLAVVNALWAIVSGERYKHDDPQLSSIVRRMTEAFEESAKGGALLIFAPWIKHLIPELSGYNSVRKVLEDLKSFVSKTIASHKASYSSDDSPRDFVDIFLREMKSTTDPKSSFYKEIGAKWPKVQKEFQEEIKWITGNNRPVSVNDRTSMPYTQALIEEVLRLSSIVPLGVPHRALANTTVRGVFIPKDTIIFVNMYYIHHNPALWDDPNTFKPERFLSDDGKVFKKNENLIPFLVGRRQCLGETLARDTIFLFLTNTFQKWNTSFDPSVPEPPLTPAVGFNMLTEPYQIIVSKLK